MAHGTDVSGIGRVAPRGVHPPITPLTTGENLKMQSKLSGFRAGG